MKNTLQDLRNHLFETLEQLKDDEKPMDIERAKAVSDVAQTIINTAKVEIAFLDATGADTTGEFFDSNYRRGKALPQREKVFTNPGDGGRTVGRGCD